MTNLVCNICGDDIDSYEEVAYARHERKGDVFVICNDCGKTENRCRKVGGGWRDIRDLKRKEEEGYRKYL